MNALIPAVAAVATLTALWLFERARQAKPVRVRVSRR
jgi:hypothetical protein